MRAAAFEGPVDDADREISATRRSSGRRSSPTCADAGGLVWAGRDYPAARVPLRSASPDSFTIVDVSTGTLLGLEERERAFTSMPVPPNVAGWGGAPVYLIQQPLGVLNGNNR